MARIDLYSTKYFVGLFELLVTFSVHYLFGSFFILTPVLIYLVFLSFHSLLLSYSSRCSLILSIPRSLFPQVCGLKLLLHFFTLFLVKAAPPLYNFFDLTYRIRNTFQHRIPVENADPLN